MYFTTPVKETKKMAELVWQRKKVNIAERVRFFILMQILKFSLKLYLWFFRISRITEKKMLTYVQQFNNRKEIDRFVCNIRDVHNLLFRLNDIDKYGVLRLNKANVEYFLEKTTEFLEDIALINATPEEKKEVVNLLNQVVEKRENLSSL